MVTVPARCVIPTRAKTRFTRKTHQKERACRNKQPELHLSRAIMYQGRTCRESTCLSVASYLAAAPALPPDHVHTTSRFFSIPHSPRLPLLQRETGDGVRASLLKSRSLSYSIARAQLHAQERKYPKAPRVSPLPVHGFQASLYELDCQYRYCQGRSITSFGHGEDDSQLYQGGVQ